MVLETVRSNCLIGLNRESSIVVQRVSTYREVLTSPDRKAMWTGTEYIPICECDSQACVSRHSYVICAHTHPWILYSVSHINAHLGKLWYPTYPVRPWMLFISYTTKSCFSTAADVDLPSKAWKIKRAIHIDHSLRVMRVTIMYGTLDGKELPKGDRYIGTCGVCLHLPYVLPSRYVCTKRRRKSLSTFITWLGTTFPFVELPLLISVTLGNYLPRWKRTSYPPIT